MITPLCFDTTHLYTPGVDLNMFCTFFHVSDYGLSPAVTQVWGWPGTALDLCHLTPIPFRAVQTAKLLSGHRQTGRVLPTSQSDNAG